MLSPACLMAGGLMQSHACTRRCLGTHEPRAFAAGPQGILCNLCELVVHEIEAAAERAAQRGQSEQLLAAMDLYQDAFMLVDTTVPRWRILHLNLMAATELGAAPLLCFWPACISPWLCMEPPSSAVPQKAVCCAMVSCRRRDACATHHACMHDAQAVSLGRSGSQHWNRAVRAGPQVAR